MVESEVAEQFGLMSLQLFRLGQVGRAQHYRDGQTDDDQAPIQPARTETTRQHPAQRVSQPDPVGALAQQHRAGMPNQPLAVGLHRQPLIPPDMLRHQEGAPDSLLDMT
ncbi:hypothetical protein F4556_006235 [Kitasatospora gansuensis]|uniref:Uncharacterized protein n=1 Tax=Kitasatospora gansuensis TaxID=258050 RepID=A0A7W7WL59_9ACTN|nr:hypothetical protein [Kitasatospora gansuensis]MBB4950700.1 hypothetical protein [Kitasatospora gansuensis]